MKQIETKQKERYEPPAVLDISPVTVNGSAGTSPLGNGEPENAKDYE